jgi:hypothetical protein
MSLSPLTSEAEIRQARETMLATLRPGCRKLRRWIGWQGGRGEFDTYWNSHEEFWWAAVESQEEQRHILFFGSDDPAGRMQHGIDVEVNPPKSGIDRRCAGLFVRDTEGAVYLTHSGKVGGGRRGIGKNAFQSAYRGARETVSWPDGEETEVIVIGRIDSEQLQTHVSHFVWEVRRFKTSVSGGRESSTDQEQSSPPEPGFKPEFFGRRRGYHVRSEIETRCDHGLIVNALAEALEAMGLKVANDQNRDLYIPARNGQMKLLFEVKPDKNTSAVYQAIGQLLYHSANQTSLPTLVMVLPAEPDTTTKRVLDRLQIKVLAFDWQDQQPTFRNLAAIIN